MDIEFFEKITEEGLIDPAALALIKDTERSRPVSVKREVVALLSLGVLLFTTGIGIFIYKNIDTIGHTAIIAAITLLTAGCYTYCFRHARPFGWHKVAAPGEVFDYVLLLGSLLLVSLIGYVQFQYHLFGTQWGLATFIPMVILFATAYYFDHLGVLSLAITALAAWAGIAVSPMQLLSNNNFSDSNIMYSGMVVGGALLALSTLSVQRSAKAHFAYTYKNFGIHLFFISVLAAMFPFSSLFLLWFLVFAIAVIFQWLQAVQHRSFYFLLVTVLYAYAGISYFVFRLLSAGSGVIIAYIGMLYVIGSSVGLILLLVHYNKTLHNNDRIQ